MPEAPESLVSSIPLTFDLFRSYLHWGQRHEKILTKNEIQKQAELAEKARRKALKAHGKGKTGFLNQHRQAFEKADADEDFVVNARTRKTWRKLDDDEEEENGPQMEP